jgi:N-acetyl-gamma-glutamyl-phosphate reductase
MLYSEAMKIGVIGASGYAGGELLRLLLGHPEFVPIYISAGSNAGEEITAVHQHLTSYAGQKFEKTEISRMNECDLLFVALPHGESAKLVSQINPAVKIVDLGADYRLNSAESWSRYYGGAHAGTWVYGLPEMPGQRSKISTSTRVANPGCYATAIALASAPAIAQNLIDSTDIVVVASSGTTGAGRSAKVNLLGSEVMNTLTSYKFGGVHQHTPEIEETLSSLGQGEAKISFTPILAPMPRGILATVTAKLAAGVTYEKVRDAYLNHYAQEPCVILLPEGQLPKTSSVLGSNAVHLQVAVDSHTNRLIVSSAIDNLGKGAASQAIQNANILCGLPELSSLSTVGTPA